MGLKVFSRKKSAANNKVGYEPSPSGQQQQEKQQQPQVKCRGRYSSQNSVTSRRSLRSLGSNTFGSSKQKKSTTTTTGTNYYDDNYQQEIVKQMKSRHRDGGNYNNVRVASPDTSEESSFIEEDSWDEAWGDGGGGCGIFDDVRMLNDDDDDDESGDIYSSSHELSTIKSSAPIGIPRLAGCKAWLCVEADNVSFEETTTTSGGGERYDHQGQLDIYVSKRGGSVNSLKLRSYANVPRPEKSDHILVKVEASTVSMRDLVRDGQNPVPGRQILGRVHQLGEKVDRSIGIRVGDSIVALTPNGGGNGRYASIPAKSAIVLPPDARRADDVVCLVESYMSAYQMLNLGRREVSSSRGKKPKSYKYNGANVLIIGSSDPVGQAMVELALREGANVFATSERSHRQYMQNMGATWFPNDPEKLVQLKGTMDVVVDTMCLDGYRSSYEALHRNGKLICTSNPPKQNDATLFQQWGKSWSTFHANHIWPDVKVYDIHKSFKDDRQTFEHDFKHLLHKLDRGDIRPKISGVIALNQVPKAQRLIEKGLPNGTVVVLPWAELDATQHVPKEVFH